MIPLLTPRQLEVLEALAKGLTNREIARVLGISTSTAKAHVSAVLKALDVTNRTEAVGLLAELRLLDDADEERSGDATRVRSVPGFGDRPAIAVLPFEVLGSEPGVIADGLVNDLINGLASFRWFPVISRTSSFYYRESPAALTEVSRELGARYLVEGSARTGGGRLRIQVQLVDATDQHQVWSARYDRVLDDVLTVQDEIAESIVGALEPTLLQVEGLRALRAPQRGDRAIGSWEHFQTGMAKLYRQRPDDVRASITCFESAIEHEPSFAPAHAALSVACVVNGMQTVGLTRYEGGGAIREAIERAAARFSQSIRCGEHAVALDPMDPIAHLGLGVGRGITGDVGSGLASVERALELNPSSAFVCWGFGNVLMWSERWREAPNWYLRAIRLSPRDPYLHHFHGDLAAAYFRGGDDVAAAEHARRAVDLQQPGDPFTQRPILVASLARQGRVDEARTALDQLRNETPRYNLEMERLLLGDETTGELARGLRESGWREPEA